MYSESGSAAGVVVVVAVAEDEDGRGEAVDDGTVSGDLETEAGRERGGEDDGLDRLWRRRSVEDEPRRNESTMVACGHGR